MRLLYIVTYDICDDSRWRKVFKIMHGHGDHLKYSVFRCMLSDLERIGLLEKLSKVIKHDTDQVLMFPLGPVDGLDALRVVAIGLPLAPMHRGAIIV